MTPPRTVTCRACLERLTTVRRYRVGKPIVVTPVLNPGGHAMYRHQSGGAISLCIAPLKETKP